jgi:hypothetical protein
VVITTLGAAGGREQLNVLYTRAAPDVRRAVIAGLFNARADEDLIRIARTDRDAGCGRRPWSSSACSAPRERWSS